jgi:uncharacterized MAPEG superfamily protein
MLIVLVDDKQRYAIRCSHGKMKHQNPRKKPMLVIPYLCLVVALILAYWPRSVAAREMARLPGGYDNHDPRNQQSRLEGIGRRAIAAHLNGMEAFPMFGISVLAAMQRSVDIRWVVLLCVVFLAARVTFVLAYVNDRASLRSAMFLVGLLTCFVLFGFAAFA